ncbi:hypothetical protein KIS4809_0564 [Bacillus sp. ZZV12-4809]|nr:hypothetical protein KIS4809_0564 [Bacillus sp. ZZV12-4809]
MHRAFLYRQPFEGCHFFVLTGGRSFCLKKRDPPVSIHKDKQRCPGLVEE